MSARIIASGLSALAAFIAGQAMPVAFPNAPQWIGQTGLVLSAALAILALVFWWWDMRRVKQAPPTEAQHQIDEILRKHSDGLRKIDDPITVSKEVNVQVGTKVTLDRVVHRAADRDASLREALAYAAFGNWNNRQIAQFQSGDSNRYSDALAKFHQLAADGTLRVWGIPVSYQATTVYQPIDKAHWGYAAIDYLDALRDKPFTLSKVPQGLTYTDIRVNRAEFEREWPHA